MEARSTLSQEQKTCLERLYTFLRGATAFLESIESTLPPDERLTAGNLCELAVLCEQKLIESFPELHSWLAEWERGGGR